MKKVFFIHGFSGVPNGGWIPWLLKELSVRGVYATALPMPNPKKPVVSEWIEEINHALSNALEDEIYLIGHSLGATAILRYLEILPKDKKIAGVLLISGLISPLEPDNAMSNYRAIDSFVVPDIDLLKVKPNSEKFTVFQSIDDPAVPYTHGEKISKELECQLVTVNKGGHFYILSEPIAYELPTEFLEALDEMLK